MSVLQELEDTTQSVIRRVGPAVVGVGQDWGMGSGVVVANGQVLTNAHNLRGDGATVTFGDGRSEAGRVVGVDPDGDLAAIAVDTGAVPPIEWSSAADALRMGTPIFALANPGGRGLRVTMGFVSATGQRLRGPRGRLITGIIEHTAPLPRGSSGGPVVDGAGRLLGLNTVRLDGGLILALGADAALRARADALWRGETPRRPRLGVVVASPDVARRLRRAVGLSEKEGLLVQEVEPGGPAAQAGIERGDVLVSADGRPLASSDGLHALLDATGEGGDLELHVLRGEEERDVRLTPADLPSERPRRRGSRRGCR